MIQEGSPKVRKKNWSGEKEIFIGGGGQSFPVAEEKTLLDKEERETNKKIPSEKKKENGYHGIGLERVNRNKGHAVPHGQGKREGILSGGKSVAEKKNNVVRKKSCTAETTGNEHKKKESLGKETDSRN